MSDCKCKAILNIIPKCDPTLDIKPNCPVVLDVATTQRGAPGKDATINGVNALEIETSNSITNTMEGSTLTISGAELEQAIADEETRASAAETALQTNITAEENRAKGVEQQLAGSIDSNHQAISNHVSDTDNPHQVTKAQIGLGNVENLAPADMPMSTATKTYVDNADNDLQGQITTINTTIGGYGNIVTHNVSEFATSAQGALADTALQPNDNISELTNNLNYQTATQVANSIAVETNNRESADNNLQSQIDAIVSASDVFDIVGTYAELQAYDISTVPVNDIIKVLVDSTHSGAATYYRCVESGGVKSWSYIGSEGAYYTKAEADSNFVPQTRTVNNKALSSDITLTASDVGALPSSTVIPTVNDATVTIQKNGNTVSAFTLNQSSNETVNLTVPTATSDLNNDSGFITSADLPTNYVTTDTAQDISAKKTFLGEKAILFKQTATTDKLGFTLYTSTNSELGALEYRPNTISGNPLLNLNCSQSGNVWLGFRYWSNINIIAPKPSNGNYYIPVNITDGNTTVTAGSNGTVNISSFGYIKSINSSDVTTALGYTPVNPSSLATVATSGSYNDLLDKPTMPTALSTNIADVVGTYAELQAYNTSTLPVNSIVEVLEDSNNSNKHSYYRWVSSGSGGAFVQPVLSADGTIGGDSFAVAMSSVYSGRPAWYAFDGVTTPNPQWTNVAHTGNSMPAWFEFYNPVPICVTKMAVTNGNINPINYQFQASSDGTTWITLVDGVNQYATPEADWRGYTWEFDVPNTDYYKYYRFYVTSGTYLQNCSILEFEITATEEFSAEWQLVADEGQFVPTSRTINSKALSSDITLTASDVGAYPDNNPSGYITGISSSDVTTALGYTPVNPTSLATVATSGSYTDLSNKPTIPTVNNATLTIQKNGTTVKTFTANASSNVTANITVPTNTNELTNGAGFITGITSGDVTTALGYTPANDSNVLKTSGNQNISGAKKYANNHSLVVRNANVTKGTNPSAQQYWNIGFTDTNSADYKDRLGVIECYLNTDGSTQMQLKAYKNVAQSTSAEYIGVTYPASGSAYTYAPTPATSDNSTKIATTAYVKAQGYALDSAVVKTSGNQTVNGTKTFGNSIKAKGGFDVINANATKGTNPASTVYWGLFRANDSTDSSTWANTRLGIGEVSLDANGNTKLMLGVYRNEAGSTANSNLSIIYDKVNGTRYCTLSETPATGDNSTKAATTAFVNNWVAANTSEVAVVVESEESGYHGWRIWSDGWVEQWGVTTVNSANAWQDVTLYKPYASNIYQVIGCLSGTGTSFGNFKVRDYSLNTTTKFGLAVSSAGLVVRWYASGQGA